MSDNIWDKNGNAYQLGDGTIVSIETARRMGKIVDRPFEQDGTGYLRNEVIYASEEDADKDD